MRLVPAVLALSLTLSFPALAQHNAGGSQGGGGSHGVGGGYIPSRGPAPAHGTAERAPQREAAPREQAPHQQAQPRQGNEPRASYRDEPSPPKVRTSTKMTNGSATPMAVAMPDFTLTTLGSMAASRAESDRVTCGAW